MPVIFKWCFGERRNLSARRREGSPETKHKEKAKRCAGHTEGVQRVTVFQKAACFYSLGHIAKPELETLKGLTKPECHYKQKTAGEALSREVVLVFAVRDLLVSLCCETPP